MSGPSVFTGYYKQQDKTDEVLETDRQGWWSTSGCNRNVDETGVQLVKSHARGAAQQELGTRVRRRLQRSQAVTRPRPCPRHALPPP